MPTSKMCIIIDNLVWHEYFSWSGMHILIAKALFLFTICCGCNNVGKDSIGMADSANEAKLDTGLLRNDIVVDETSSAFMVRAANNGMTDVQLAKHTELKGASEEIKSFAATIYRDHSEMNQRIKELAAAKDISLPTTVSLENQTEIDQLVKISGNELDKQFIKMIVKTHVSSIDLFEKAITGTKDIEVRAFADKALPALRKHYETAKALDKNYRK